MSTPIKENDVPTMPDYAAQLRAAMDAQDRELDTPVSATHNDDEVSRLLREQLALFDKPSDVSARVELQALEEFERELEEALEDNVDEIPEADEIIEEELPEEDEIIEEELPEEDEIIEEEELPEEDEIIEEEELPEEDEIIEEELPEEDEMIEEEELPEEDEIIEEELPEEDEIIEEELPEDEEIFEEETEEVCEVSVDEAVEEILAQIGLEDEMIEGVMPASDDVIQSYLQEIETWERVEDEEDDTQNVTDDDINDCSLKDILQGAVLTQLDEETRDSLRRMGVVEEEEPEQLDVFTVERQPDVPHEKIDVSVAEDTPRVTSEKTQDASTEQVRYDPLQLTLDEYQKTRRYPQRTDATLSAREEETPTSTVSEHYETVQPQEMHQRDTEMYVNLGYEGHISRTQDANVVETVSQNTVRQDTYQNGDVDIRNTEPVAYKGEEYTSSAQNCTIERAYQKAAVRSRIHMWITLAVALCGLIYDILPDIASFLGEPVELYVNIRAYPAYGILLLWFGILPSITKLCRGIRSLWEFKPVTYAIPAVAVVVSWLQAIIACLLPGQGVRLYIGGALLFVFFACLGDCFKVASESVSFHVVSSGKPVYLLAKELVTEEKDADDEEEYLCTWRVRKVSKLADYFMWVTRYHREEIAIGGLLPMAFLCAVAVTGGIFVTGAIRGDGNFWIQGLSAFVGVFLMTLPACFIINMTLPLMTANRIIGRHGSTILSADAVREYAPDDNGWADPDPDAVKLIFAAGDVLGAGNIKEITVKGDPDTAEYRKMARRLFALLGSPLSGEDHKLRARDLKNIHLEIVEADENCLRLYMVDKPREISCEILMGTHEALLRRGIRLPREHMEQKYKKTGDSRVIYLAFDRKFRLAYATKYMPRRSFASVVPVLGQLGHALSVMSFDPLVTSDVLASATTPEVPHIQLQRPHHIIEEQDRRSCGIMATGRAVDMAYPLLACRRIKKTEVFGRLVACSSMAFAMALMTVLLWTGLVGYVSSIILWLWQFGFVGLMALVNYVCINSKKLAIVPPMPKRKTDHQK